MSIADDQRANPTIMIRDALGYRFEMDGQRVWGFTGTGWRETLKGVCDPTWAARELATAGVLAVTPSQARTNQFVKKVGGETKRLFAFKPSAINGEDAT